MCYQNHFYFINRNRKLIFLFLLFFGRAIFTNAQNFGHDAGSMGAGNTGLNTTNVFSVFNNQAGLAFLNKTDLGITYHNSYFIKELGTSSFAFVQPTKYGNFGLGVNYFGFKMYNYFQTGIAYAYRFSNKFAVGMKINYLSLQQEAYYGNAQTVAGEIGIIAKPIENLSIGAYIFNPTYSRYNGELVVPTFEKVGLSYQFSDKLIVNLEQKSNFEYNIIRFGLDYKLIELLDLRCGVESSSSAFGGLGINIGVWQLNLAVAYSNASLVSTNSFSSAVDLIFTGF